MDLYLFHLDVSLCLISNTSASVLDVNECCRLELLESVYVSDFN